MGRDRKSICRYASSIGFKINYYSRKKIFLNNSKYKYYSSIEKVIKNSDIISVHLALNNATKKIINKRLLLKLRDKYIINTSRGDLIDEKFLYKLLKKNYILGAGLDVFVNEPTIKLSAKLRNLSNVVSTCHTSFFDKTTIEQMCKSSVDIIKKKLNK